MAKTKLFFLTFIGLVGNIVNLSFEDFANNDYKAGVIRSHENVLPQKRIEVPDDLPKFFDASEKWLKCDFIRHVRDVGSCSSSWAVSVASVITDRACITSDGKINELISAEDILSCCGDDCGKGCGGGIPAKAWNFWVEKGVPTGGLYRGSGCRPYSIPPCGHWRPIGPHPPCYSLEVSETPKCDKSCVSSDKTYEEDKVKGDKVYSVSGEKEIMTEIMTNGPVQAVMQVFGDFPVHREGVYYHQVGFTVGNHSVKIIGWGEDSDDENDPSEPITKYWVAVNSWNANWGERGLFKIRRGNNECGIESQVMAGVPIKH